MKEEVLDKIVETAGDLFRRQGYASVRMEDIARELGMSKKTLYQHVDSKEALLQVICDRMHREFEQHSTEVLKSTKLSLEEKIFLHTEFCSAKLNRLHPAFFHDVKRHAPKIDQWLMELRYEGVTDTISTLLEQGRKEGLVRKDVSMKLMIESFRVVVLQVLQPESLESVDLTASQANRQIMELFFNGILIRRKN
ncbi:MAG: TetR/AcrR family transcriptional regulator [Verrucomicrobiales bacterium]|jgi:AcrR family transcriptional regulator|nr:TetR/AcrR family transcriptional regulator [Verrucomicrobiales bacterium]